MRTKLSLVVPALLVGFAVGYLVKPRSTSSFPAIHQEPGRVEYIMVFGPEGEPRYCLKPTFIFDSDKIAVDRGEVAKPRRHQWNVVLSGGYNRPVTFYCDQVEFP